MNQLLNLITEIQNRPGLYIGSESVSKLYMFIQGYSYAHYEQDNDCLQEDEATLAGFQTWVEQKYQMQISRSWDAIILFHSDNEIEAFQKFYALFEEYQAGLHSLNGKSTVSNGVSIKNGLY